MLVPRSEKERPESRSDFAFHIKIIALVAYIEPGRLLFSVIAYAHPSTRRAHNYEVDPDIPIDIKTGGLPNFGLREL